MRSWAWALALLIEGAAGWVVAGPRRVELITDAGFRQGFQVIHPQEPGRVTDRLQRPGVVGSPVWRLVEWNTRQSVAGSRGVGRGEGAIWFTNACKGVGLGPDGGEGRGVWFRMNGGAEYGERLRRPEEPWPHLLAEQDFATRPGLGELLALRFRLACRLEATRPLTAPEERRPWHCAQFQVFLIVRNGNPRSPGFGDYLWFGVPVYDSRYRQPVAHAARDTAGTGKFIYTPAGSRYTERSAGEGGWVSIDTDVLPLIREGLQEAWRQGFLGGSREAGDFQVHGLNIGWELTGTLEVEMRFRDLSLEAEYR